MMGNVLDDQGWISSRGKKFDSSPPHPASSVIVLPLGKRGRGVKLATYLHLVARSRKVELHVLSPILLHAVVFN
jgi:hypothetical protein